MASTGLMRTALHAGIALLRRLRMKQKPMAKSNTSRLTNIIGFMPECVFARP